MSDLQRTSPNNQQLRDEIELKIIGINQLDSVVKLRTSLSDVSPLLSSATTFQKYVVFVLSPDTVAADRGDISHP